MNSSLLFAVHITDGVLAPSWQAAGLLIAAMLVCVGAWRMTDEDIPRIALLTAAFFVASFIHVPIGMVTSVHLLLNGLMGIVLGRRAALAIPLGVGLQALLLQHGGYAAIGVNACVMTLPAIVAWQLFALLQRTPVVRHPLFRAALVFFSCLTWTLSLVYGVVLFATNYDRPLSLLDLESSNAVTFQPITLLIAVGVAAMATWCERRLENAPEFPMGLLVGEISVLTTTLLNAVVLIFGGEEDWPFLVLATIVPHVLIAVIEGIILGFTVGFLARVKPELVGWSTAEPSRCMVNSAP